MCKLQASGGSHAIIRGAVRLPGIIYIGIGEQCRQSRKESVGKVINSSAKYI